MCAIEPPPPSVYFRKTALRRELRQCLVSLGEATGGRASQLVEGSTVNTPGCSFGGGTVSPRSNYYSEIL